MYYIQRNDLVNPVAIATMDDCVIALPRAGAVTICRAWRAGQGERMELPLLMHLSGAGGGCDAYRI